jgi:hypothetical protein
LPTVNFCQPDVYQRAVHFLLLAVSEAQCHSLNSLSSTVAPARMKTETYRAAFTIVPRGRDRYLGAITG